MTSIAVVGAGFGGVGAAVMLRRAGYREVVVFERGERVRGVWHQNSYPGAAACDVPSHLDENGNDPNQWPWLWSTCRRRTATIVPGGYALSSPAGSPVGALG